MPIQGEPALAWVQEVQSPSYATHVVRWNGTAWTALGGPLAVILAYLLVESLPTTVVRVLVLVVILYTALTMLRSAAVERNTADARRM